VMDGAIVDPTTDAPVFPVNTPRAVVLPAVPGQAGYSPIVRLHDFPLPSGASLGQYTAICTNLTNCQPNEIDLTKAGPSFNTIFIVATAP
jgi:hypothetical protein